MKTGSRLALFFCVTLGIMTFSCKKEPLVYSKYHLGEAFLLNVNEQKSLSPALQDQGLSDSSITVSFQKVINDSRCAKSECFLCLGSSVSIQLLLTSQKYSINIPLTILGCLDEYTCDDNLYYRVDTLGNRICLLRLEPYPDIGKKASSSNYTAKLFISRQ